MPLKFGQKENSEFDNIINNQMIIKKNQEKLEHLSQQSKMMKCSSSNSKNAAEALGKMQSGTQIIVRKKSDIENLEVQLNKQYILMN